jgi:hypothetical protein
VPLIDPGEGGDAEHPTGDEVGEVVGHLDQRLIGTLDGGVSRRLVRRCRVTAAILLSVGAALLLVVAVAPSGAVSALLVLLAATVLGGSVQLLRRATLWTGVAGSMLPESARNASPQPRNSAHHGANVPPSIPGLSTTVGPARPLSPSVASGPIKRRLGSAVVPIYADDGPSPGDGALVVHARADGMVLTEGDTVLVWRAGNGGLSALPETVEGARPASARGRFVLSRESDGEVFLATTRLTDTW